MKDGMLTITIKLALFLMIASVLMLFFTAYGSAEWIISLFSALLMFLLIVIIQIIFYVRKRRNKK